MFNLKKRYEYDHLDGKHSFGVDLWGIGNLIAQSGLAITIPGIDSLKHLLRSSNPAERKTASDALSVVKAIHKDHQSKLKCTCVF